MSRELVDVYDDVWNLFGDLKSDTPILDSNTEVCCSHCGKNDEIELIDGYYACKLCGTFVERMIDNAAEWRFFNPEAGGHSKDQGRCGLPFNELLPKSSYNTTMCGTGKDCHIAKKYHIWNSTTYRERNLYSIFDMISIKAHNHGISVSIIDEAKSLYKKVSENRILRGDNRLGLIASSLYISCKTNHVPRSTKEIAKIFDMDLAVMTKGCKQFQKWMVIDVASTTASDFINRFASRIGLCCAAQHKCKEVATCIEVIGIVSENTPPTIAAACICLSSMIFNLNISKSDISKISGISSVTISKCMNRLCLYKDIITDHLNINSYNNR
jgi:transcription initiation factor TFIIB